LSTAVLLLRNGKTCDDVVLQSLAKDDNYRFALYKQLASIHRENRFPIQYLNQTDMTKSALVSSGSGKTFFAVEYVDKKWIQYRQAKGWVYLFKYKINKDDEDWQIGISGLQPGDLKKVATIGELVSLTNKMVKKDKPIDGQFDEQLNRLLFSKHKSALSFYLNNGYYMNRNDVDD